MTEIDRSYLNAQHQEIAGYIDNPKTPQQMVVWLLGKYEALGAGDYVEGEPPTPDDYQLDTGLARGSVTGGTSII